MMHNYYNEAGRYLGYGYAVLDCGNEEKHKPHTYKLIDTRPDDPYLCPGNPWIHIYDTPKRVPIY